MPVTNAVSTSLSIQSFTSSEPGAWSNSYLISGESEAILFDVFMLHGDAKQIADGIAKSGKNLKTVMISHAHPDHFMGSDVITERFPTARVVSTQNVVTDIKTDGPWMFSMLHDRLGPEGPTRLVIPEPLSGTDLTIEGVKLDVVEFGEGESKHIAAWLLPGCGGHDWCLPKESAKTGARHSGRGHKSSGRDVSGKWAAGKKSMESSSTTPRATLSDLKITKDQSSEWQQLRVLGACAVEF